MVLAVVVPASAASAHAGNVIATNYRARIQDLTPSPPGISVHLVEAGGRVELTNRTPQELTILGYEDEPYLRIGPRGVFENRRSPAVYLNATRTGGTAPPPDASATATPQWVRIGDGPTARWHDHRLHWMVADPPEVHTAPHRSHVVARWEIPMRLGAQHVALTGDIVYVPGPPVWPWILGALLLAGLVVMGASRVGARRVLLAAVAVIVLLDVVRVVGLTFVVAGGAHAQARQAVNVGAVDLVAWGLGIAAAVRLLGRKPDGPIAAGVTGLLLATVGGVLDWSDLGRSQLAVATPAVLARACIAGCAGIGAGMAAAVLADTARPRALRRK